MVQGNFHLHPHGHEGGENLGENSGRQSKHNIQIILSGKRKANTLSYCNVVSVQRLSSAVVQWKVESWCHCVTCFSLYLSISAQLRGGANPEGLSTEG